MNTPQATLAEFNSLLDAMQTTLVDERCALEKRDVESLAQCVERKSSICTTLAADKFGMDLQAKIQALFDEERQECETVHTEMISKLKEI